MMQTTVLSNCEGLCVSRRLIVGIFITVIFITMFSLLKNLFGQSNDSALATALQEGAFLVDVRTPAEFAQGSAKGAVNIPLDQIQKQIAAFKGKKHIVVFCRSGNRSSQAKAILEQNGFTNVINGGTWQHIDALVK
ncbi:MAG: rhodanese-like domain-containing protein [Cytophagales bacterium]|nr:rhodanese-like domain-containing protein [Bernardetiaceae bacterium]MDW8205932.1 rhodanese-like domain-containing protein [Cytophagales bacterium]